MKILKVGQRVSIPKLDFLSDGNILKVIKSPFGAVMYIVKLDKFAPNEYAYNTDEVLMFSDDLEVITE